MSIIREKLSDLLAEVELFIEELSGRIDTTIESIDSFAPAIVQELDIFTPLIESIQAESIGHIETIEADLEEILQGTN